MAGIAHFGGHPPNAQTGVWTVSTNNEMEHFDNESDALTYRDHSGDATATVSYHPELILCPLCEFSPVGPNAIDPNERDECPECWEYQANQEHAESLRRG